MKRSKGMLEKISSTAGFPDEPLPGRPLIEVLDQCRVLIENHHGVTEYAHTNIRVKVKYGSICVCGNHLELARMTKGQLIITGHIDGIQLCRG